MVDTSKRTFCRKYFFQQAAKIVSGFNAGVREAKEKEAFEDFFESYDSSYSLTLAYPDEIMIKLPVSAVSRPKDAVKKRL